MKKKALAAFVVATAVTSAPARAEMTDLGHIPGTWYSLGVHNETKTCGAKSLFTNGVLVAMMRDRESDSWFFMLAHRDWKFQEGQKYDGSVSIDGRLFTGEVTAVNEHSIGLYISDSFLHAFTAGSGLTIHHTSGAALATISLAGTTKMVDAVARCSQVMQAQIQRQQQPFGPPKVYSMPEMPFAPKADSNTGRRFAGPERPA
jgi:hypothetical protein